MVFDPANFGTLDARAARKVGRQAAVQLESDGLQQVQLKSLAPRQPGMAQLIVKAKRWFGSGVANDTAASTRLNVTVGGQCFTHAVTKKTD